MIIKNKIFVQKKSKIKKFYINKKFSFFLKLQKKFFLIQAADPGPVLIENWTELDLRVRINFSESWGKFLYLKTEKIIRNDEKFGRRKCRGTNGIKGGGKSEGPIGKGRKSRGTDGIKGEDGEGKGSKERGSGDGWRVGREMFSAVQIFIKFLIFCNFKTKKKQFDFWIFHHQNWKKIF